MVDERRERYINPYTDFGFKKLFEQAEIARFTPQEVMEYEDSLKVYRDLKNSMDTSFVKGENSKSISIARKMKAKGYPTDDIAEITGLTKEEIENL